MFFDELLASAISLFLLDLNSVAASRSFVPGVHTTTVCSFRHRSCVKTQYAPDAVRCVICSAHLCCAGTRAVSDTAALIALLLLLLGPTDVLPLLHEPLVDDPRHAVVPVQRSSGRSRWNTFQVLQTAFRLLA